jgi:hypothetical protein
MPEPVVEPRLARTRWANWPCGLYLRRLAFALFSGIPTQVVVPSVSRAAVPQGTALTVRVETPSGATTFNPGP